jgi:hypothetical protein
LDDLFLDGRRKRDMRRGEEGGAGKISIKIGYNNSCDKNNNTSRRSEACP